MILVSYLRSRGNTFPRFFFRNASGFSTVQGSLAYKFSTASSSRKQDSNAREEDSSITAATKARKEIQRLQHRRNVGIFAHVDAGKTTVTERMLALAGIIRQAGSVDDGNTVTDYLDAERERGITIQSAAVSFDWIWHNNPRGDDYEANDSVTITLIDTPGHVDFSVEVNRSVAVLDGAILVIDSVAHVQAQTETVWRAMTRNSLNNHSAISTNAEYSHEPLPCLAVINKMDKEGSDFYQALDSIRDKLPGANPVPIQIPLFLSTNKEAKSTLFEHGLAAPLTSDDCVAQVGDFIGIVDIIHMRAVVYPEGAINVSDVEMCAPRLIPLLDSNHQPIDANCQVTQSALKARQKFVENMAECDEQIEELYILEETLTNADLRAALRRAVLQRKALPVMASSAVKGKGVEPILDAVADLLPSPLERQPPGLRNLHDASLIDHEDNKISIGHPLHPSLLGLVFKVLHMKGRGGSGDGRVVFARIYSGTLHEKDSIQVVHPPILGAAPEKPYLERINGILELSGGRFGNLETGECRSGEVCAIVGLKNVVTGDTISAPHGPKSSRKDVYLAGVSSPKPVLTVRLETESTTEHTKLSKALELMAVEDPSLVVEDNESFTLLSGLGELHIEVTLDRIQRERGIRLHVGDPFVTYHETVTVPIESNGLVNYDKVIGDKRMQAAVSLEILPANKMEHGQDGCYAILDPVVEVSNDVLEYLDLDPESTLQDLMVQSPLVRSIVNGCTGALKRGPNGMGSISNVICRVRQIEAEGGLSQLHSQSGSLQAAASFAVSSTLKEHLQDCIVLEPTMTLEISSPTTSIGDILSDLSSRRGTVGEVDIGDSSAECQARALLRGTVPLIEIIGYASSLRSLTGGEAYFSAEYLGHSPK